MQGLGIICSLVSRDTAVDILIICGTGLSFGLDDTGYEAGE